MDKKNIEQLTFTITKTVSLSNVQVSTEVLDLIKEYYEDYRECTVDDVIHLDRSKHEALDIILKLAEKAEGDDQLSYYGVVVDEIEISEE